MGGKEDGGGCFVLVIFQRDDRPWRRRDAVLADKFRFIRVKDGRLAEKRGRGIFESVL
jgi:hypothetical protein